MGTPEFAVPSLKALIDSEYDIVAVITSPDKPAGRGKVLQPSPVKKFAAAQNLTILQPENLKDEDFVENLRKLNADLQIVVAFRILPEIVWSMPPLGTFNLHSSLLPQYRGAAPINHAIINGEKKTGVSTFFIDQDIDTGKIILQETVDIEENDNAGSLHDKLMFMGAGAVLRTVRLIETGNVAEIPQSQLINPNESLKKAPKIFKEDCRIPWEQEGRDIVNFVRGLSPYPSAFSILVCANNEEKQMKLFEVTFEKADLSVPQGTIISDNKEYLKVASLNGYISIQSLQLQGKNRMDVKSFLAGFRDITACRFV